MRHGNGEIVNSFIQPCFRPPLMLRKICKFRRLSQVYSSPQGNGIGLRKQGIKISLKRGEAKQRPGGPWRRRLPISHSIPSSISFRRLRRGTITVVSSNSHPHHHLITSFTYVIFFFVFFCCWCSPSPFILTNSYLLGWRGYIDSIK